LITAGLSSTPPLGTRSTPPAALDGEPQLTTASPSAASPSRMRPTPSTAVHGGPQLPTAVPNGNAPAAPASATSKPVSQPAPGRLQRATQPRGTCHGDDLQLRNERRCLVRKLEADREVLRGRLDACSRSGADPLAQTQQVTGTGHPEAAQLTAARYRRRQTVRQRSPQDLARRPLSAPDNDVLYVSSTTPRRSGIDVLVAYLRPHYA
jgi:hypothetical protein